MQKKAGIRRKNILKMQEADSQPQEWKEFPKPAGRWTLNRV
jgi:hypothetical protein